MNIRDIPGMGVIAAANLKTVHALVTLEDVQRMVKGDAALGLTVRQSLSRLSMTSYETIELLLGALGVTDSPPAPAAEELSPKRQRRKKERPATVIAAEAVACPQCGAAAGASCKNYRDINCAPHGERQRVAGKAV